MRICNGGRYFSSLNGFLVVKRNNNNNEGSWDIMRTLDKINNEDFGEINHFYLLTKKITIKLITSRETSSTKKWQRMGENILCVMAG